MWFNERMTEKEALKTWVACWQRAGSALDKIRAQSMQTIGTADSIESLSDAFESAHIHLPLSLTSGLVEQQRYFRQLKT